MATKILNSSKSARKSSLQSHADITNLHPEILLEQLKYVRKLYEQRRITTLTPLLKLFHVRGKTYNSEDFFYMYPIYRLQRPQRTLLKFARQTGKSTAITVRQSIDAMSIEYLSTLNVCPLYSQVHRLSTNYFNQILGHKLFKSIDVVDAKGLSVLKKTLHNNSIIQFTFAFIDVDRVRGFAADIIWIDEFQDMNQDFVPIIENTLDASEMKISYYSGTPKTFDNTMQIFWEQSSQGEWVVKCDHCGKHNMACVQAELLKMIKGKDGPVCAFCDHRLNPVHGFWKHLYPERFPTLAGYHFPQPVAPRWFKRKEDWQILLQRIENRMGNWPEYRVYNECFGESQDTGATPITRADLMAACTLDWNNNIDEAVKHIHDYTIRVAGIDWSGGGAESMSFTTLGIFGMTPSGEIHNLFGIRLKKGMLPTEEVTKLLQIIHKFDCHYIAHDYRAGGVDKASILITSGFPIDRIANFVYVPASAKQICRYDKKNNYYALDKSRSLAVVMHLIKKPIAMIKFPKWESINYVLTDFLALYEELIGRSSQGLEFPVLNRRQNRSDDYTTSTNLAVTAILKLTDMYETVVSKTGISYSTLDVDFEQIAPAKPMWED